MEIYIKTETGLRLLSSTPPHPYKDFEMVTTAIPLSLDNG
ncbi:hypothetical protein C823_007690 [Eubacterium plexicaudatum ASF492]|uniref:Uncharacterized protein n=1 Tax=Eubacterium plexicaudatum ASF492 TaxID=1235802 RepID=N2A582_9FIRM|nr:hypothetical protein C823_007690 [Eubacterium plexicaudatum ASF492]